MKTKITLVLALFLLGCLAAASPQEIRVKVTSEKTSVYAEPDIHSYVIETVKKNTVLSLFQAQELDNVWYYIFFRSEERNSYVSGFVKVTAVERLSSGPKDSIPDNDQKKEGKKRQAHLDLTKQTHTKEPSEKKDPQIKKNLKKRQIKPIPERKTEAGQNSSPMKVKVTADSTAVYRNPDIKSDIMERVEKGVILNLAKKQKSPNIWKHVYFYSDKRKKHVAGYVKATAVEKIGGIQNPNYSPAGKIGAPQKISEPPVKTEARKLPLLSVPQTLELAVFLKIKSREETRVEEELSTTFFSVKELSDSEIFKNTPAVYAEQAKYKIITKKQAARTSASIKTGKKEAEKTDKWISKASSLNALNSRLNLKQEKPPLKTMPPGPKSKPTSEKTEIHHKKFKRVTLGLGYGHSHGGAGGFVQINTRTGISFHGGVGYYPTSFIYSESDWVKGSMLYSAGLKYYLPLNKDSFRLYLDLQYCGIGVEAAQVFTGEFYNGPVFENAQKTLWGPSLLTGMEIRMGMIGVNGAVGGSYNISEAEWLDNNIFLSFDIGLLVYF